MTSDLIRVGAVWRRGHAPFWFYFGARSDAKPGSTFADRAWSDGQK
jgi:hypothetical protein